LWESVPFLGRTFKRCRSDIRARILATLREREAAMRGAEKGGTGPDLLSLMLAAGIAQNVCFAQPVEASVKSFAKRWILYIYIVTE
jgi:hypothetical protein